MKKNIAVFFGGCSSEYEVSLESVTGVLRNLDPDRYTPLSVGITRKGDWYYYTGKTEQIAADTWHTDTAHCTPAALSPNRSAHELLVYGTGSLTPYPRGYRPAHSAWPLRRGRHSSGTD